MNEPTVIFYGKTFNPMSDECYGCYHYGTICEGSVYEKECRAGIVEDIKPSFVANLIMRHSKNRFILARCFGYDISQLVNVKDLTTEELQNEFQQAVSTPEEVISNYKEMFSLDMYAEKETEVVF